MHLVIIIVGIIIMVIAATQLVKVIDFMSRYFHVSEFTTSFILMGIATSIPELAVAISSSIHQNAVLSLGNIIGSNIADLTLIIGLPVLIARGIQVKSRLTQLDTQYMSILALTPLLLLFDYQLSRLDGMFLLTLYGAYDYRLIRQRSRFTRFVEQVKKPRLLKQLLLFIITILAIFISSQFVTNAAVLIAQEIDVPILIIGLIVISTGTILPELTHGIRATIMKHEGQIIGDILGSVVGNSTLIIGIAAVINPIKLVNFSEIVVPAMFLIIAIIYFLTSVYSGKRLTVRESLILIFIYLTFIISTLGFEYLRIEKYL